MSRRPGVGAGRRPGFRGIGGGGAGAYTPASDPLTLLWWDPETLADGAVASWVDSVAGVEATQGTGAAQPTKSATVIGGFPGVTFDGGDSLVAAGAGTVLSGKTSLTLTLAIVDTNTTTCVAIEHTANSSTTNGGFALLPVNSVDGRLTGLVRGTTGATIRYGVEMLSTVKVVSLGMSFGTAGAGAVKFIRVDGVALSLVNAVVASAAGSIANSTLNFGQRSGGTLGLTGSLAGVAFRESEDENEALDRVERYIGSKVGKSW